MENFETIVMKDEVWSAITLEVMMNRTSAREQIQASGQQIVGCVVSNHLAVDDLRSCARWTGMLAREAAGISEQGLQLSDEERLEVSARRILHGSVKAALKEVRTEGRLVTQRARQVKQQCRQLDMPGMGRLERKDLEARTDFAEQAQ